MSDQAQSVPLQSPQLRLGRLLHELRLAKKTEIVELARTLILSTSQITAIETGSQASFHNQSFYLRALKKYIAHMGLAMDPQASLLFAEIETELLSASTQINANEVNLLINAGLVHKRSSYLSNLQLKKAHLFWVVFIAFILVGLAAAVLEGWPEKQTMRQTELVPPPTPAPVKQTDVVPDASVAQEQKTVPAAPNPVIVTSTQSSASKTPEDSAKTDNKSTVATEANKTASLKLTFLAPSWIQVVEQNGKRIEKVFTPQDSLELDASTIATLVIGNARETRLFSSTAEIDLPKYLNAGSGVARFNQSDITKLVQ